MLTSRNKIYAGLFTLLVVTLATLFLTRSPGPRAVPQKPEDWTPEETLQAFVETQQNGDVAAVTELLVKSARGEFEQMASSMSHDDLVATGLQFAQEQYKLEETTRESATFYASSSALYLVLTREDGRWRIDPARTDRLNREHNGTAVPSPSPEP